MDALRLLKEDHVKVKKMLSELEATTELAVKTREAVSSQLKDELEVHEAIEEEFLYPALKNHPKTRDIVLEAYEEHHVVDEVMLDGLPRNGNGYRTSTRGGELRGSQRRIS